MADTSLIIGNGNWAVKENSLLGYNIIQGKYVPIEMNVSRATTATRVNNAGFIELVPKNLFSQSQTFDITASWYNTGLNSTVIPNVLATSAPNGTFTADKLVATAVLGDHFILQTFTTTFSLTQLTVSVFAKKAELSNIQLFNNAGGGGTGDFDLITGNSSPSLVTSMQPYPDGWYRCIMTYTISPSAPNFNVHIKLANSSGVTSFTGNGVDGVYLWGAQLEQGSTATSYFPTTDRFNIPRVDYSTGTTGSLLVEPARTNLVLQSQTLDNASWVTFSSATVTADTITSPDGTSTADTINLSTTADTRVVQSCLIANSTTYTLSCFFKNIALTAGETFVLRYNNQLVAPNNFQMIATINLAASTVAGIASYSLAGTAVTGYSGVVSGVVEPYPNGWYRISVTATTGTGAAANGQVQIIQPNASQARSFYAWGAQLEAGSNATSYIPTTTLAAGLTRAADVITKTGISSLIGQTEGTLYFEVQGFSDGNLANHFITLSDGTVNNQIGFNYNTSGVITGYFRVNAFTYLISSTVSKTLNSKIILKYNSSNVYTLFINGFLIGTGTAASSFSSPLTTFKTSQGDNSSPYNGNIKSIVLYKTALLNQQCIDLTT